MDAYLTVYNASAGSGKTTTLIKAILKIILCLDEKELHPKKIKSVLGVTFTNAVANELKERLIRVLYELAFKEKGIENNKKYLDDKDINPALIKQRALEILIYLLHNYTDLSIHTIDSFSNRILKSFAYELNYSIAYEISTNEDYYYNKALEHFLDKIDSTTNDNFNTIKKYIINKKNEDEETYKADDLFHSIIEILRTLVQKESAVDVVDTMINKIQQINEKKIQETCSKYEINLKEEIDAFNQKIRNILKKYFKIVNEKIEKEDNEGVNGQKVNKLNSIYNNPFRYYEKNFINDNKKYFNKGYEKQNSQFVDDLRKLQEQYHSIVESQDKLNFINTLLDKIVITRLALSLLKELNTLKKEDNVVFFSDFTKEISKIIQSETNADFIFERAGVRYRNFLIDEFQDTSTLQFHNLLPLLHNAMAEGNANYIVGDPKQSIYRWRNANVKQFVELFRHKTISFEKIQKDWERFKDKISIQTLNVNYRSAKDIVEFNNKIFNNLNFDDISLIKDIYTNAQQQPYIQKEGYVEIVEYDTKLEGPLSTLDKRFKRFTEDVLKRIKECINDGYQQKDICILLRTRNDIKNVITSLQGQKINDTEELQFISSDGALVYLSKEVDFIVAFLQLLLNNDNNLASGICWNYVNNKKYQWDEIFTKNFILEYNKDKNFKRVFSSYSIASVNLYQLCLEIIDYFKIPQNSYVQKFLDIVNKFTFQYSHQGNTIEDFLNFWEKFKFNFTIQVSNDLNAINIMTIHKSKGLEFPVVFTYLKFEHQEDSYWYKLPPDFSISLDSDEMSDNIKDFQDIYFYLKPSEIEKISKEHANDLISEETLEYINLIYVAFTRAKDRMYIFADKKNTYYQNIILPKIGFMTPVNINTEKDNISKEEEELQRCITIYEYGQKKEKITSTNSTQNNNNTINISSDIKLVHNNKILLANNIYHHSEKIEQGIKIHKVLEFLKDDNIEYTINKALVKGVIRNNDVPHIKKLLENFINNEIVKPYFLNIKKILSETEFFICEEEKIYRPDKILFTKDDKVLVIEFKTGEKKNTHQTQLKNYIKIISEIYNIQIENIKGALLYINEDKIEVIEIDITTQKN